MFEIVLDSSIYKYTFVGAVIACGFFIGFTIVGKYVYSPMIEETKSSESCLTDEEKEIEDYIIRYNADYEDLEERDMTNDEINKLKDSYLTEDTPHGIVKMYFCNNNESFIYWCEKQVPYKILESVSKKYSIEYDCKYIHVDMDYELKTKREKLMNSMNTRLDASACDAGGDCDASGCDASGCDAGGACDTGGACDASDSVFVTFKKYNKVEHVSGDEKTDTNKDNKKKNKKDIIVCEKANRYSYRGPYVKVEDKPAQGECSIKNISFSEFMKAKNTFKTSSSEVKEDQVSASDGFWRFLDIKYVSNDVVQDEKRDEIVKRGVFKMNGVEYGDIDKYHTAVMEELKSTTICTVSSTAPCTVSNTAPCAVSKNNIDKSYDVLECENDSGVDNNEIVRDLSSAVVDSDTEEDVELVTSSNDVQSGKRISRRGSVDNEDETSSGWLW